MIIKYNHIYSKKLNLLMPDDIIMNSSFCNQIFFITLFRIRRKQMSLFLPIFRNIFFLIITVIITERFNIHFSKITWLAATWSFLVGCSPNFINAPLLYCWHWVKGFPTATIFHKSQNILQTFDTKRAKEIDFNTFQFGKHSF